MIEIELLPIATVFLIVVLVQCMLASRYMHSVFDPLLYFVLTTSFAITFTYFQVTDPLLFVRVVFYFVAFWIGFIASARLLGVRSSVFVGAKLFENRFSAVFIVAGVVVFLLLNIFAWTRSGIPLLSSNPSLQKSESLTAGLGFIRRFNWGAGIYFFVASLYWYIYSRSRHALACLLVMSFVSIMGGAKSAFLPVLFGLGLYLAHPFCDQKGRTWAVSIRRHSLVLFLSVLVPMVIVFLIESDGLDTAAIALMTRLLYFGDSMVFWGDQVLREHFSTNTRFFHYPAHLTNSVLGFFRIIPYEPAFGNQFVQFNLGAGDEFVQSLGPNTPFYVKGELFFGFFFGFLYSLVVGCVVGLFRLQFLSFRAGSIIRYSFLSTMAIVAMTIPTEDSLFISKVFDLLLALLIVYVLASILSFGGVIRVPRGEGDRDGL